MLRVPSRFPSSFLFALLALVLGLVACAPADPATQVAKDRQNYQVANVTWRVLEPPSPPMVEEMDPAAMEEGAVEMAEEATEASMDETADAVADEAADAAEAMAEGMEAAIEVMDDGTRAILFDVMIAKDGHDTLAGVTLDVTHASASETEKEVRRHFIETEGMAKGEVRQVAFEIDGWDYEDGDLFSVELREIVPSAERNAYPEWSGAGGG